MNWGNTLVVVFIVFGLLIGTAVYKAFHTPTDLVSKEYYKDELRYQDKIDAMNNAAQIQNFVLEQSNQEVTIDYPKEMNGKQLKGTILFYCKTDATKDRQYSIAANQSLRQMIPKNQLFKTRYTVQLSWEALGKPYYSEREIVIN